MVHDKYDVVVKILENILEGIVEKKCSESNSASSIQDMKQCRDLMNQPSYEANKRVVSLQISAAAGGHSIRNRNCQVAQVK